VLQAFLEIGCRLFGHEGLHDDGRRDGVGEGLEEAEPEARKELLLAAQENAHAGLRVVLEVQELPEFDEDVVGQALSLVDDEDGMDLVRAVELEHMILDGSEERGPATADREVEGRREVAVELGDRDGGVAEIDRPVQAHGKSRDEEPHEAGLPRARLADEDADAAALAEKTEG